MGWQVLGPQGGGLQHGPALRAGVGVPHARRGLTPCRDGRHAHGRARVHERGAGDVESAGDHPRELVLRSGCVLCGGTEGRDAHPACGSGKTRGRGELVTTIHGQLAAGTRHAGLFPESRVLLSRPQPRRLRGVRVRTPPAGRRSQRFVRFTRAGASGVAQALRAGYSRMHAQAEEGRCAADAGGTGHFGAPGGTARETVPTGTQPGSVQQQERAGDPERRGRLWVQLRWGQLRYCPVPAHQAAVQGGPRRDRVAGRQASAGAGTPGAVQPPGHGRGRAGHHRLGICPPRLWVRGAFPSPSGTAGFPGELAEAAEPSQRDVGVLEGAGPGTRAAKQVPGGLRDAAAGRRAVL
mmetsp:Transcript_7496/g.21320  ORF Transcript_7496/g.21320 Transcript_7496/m.21320 type:complete len:352 (-) Transcript_7496:624-1679(-)